MNAHKVSDVRQVEVHTAEPLVPGPSSLEVEIALAKLKKYKYPGSDQISAEMIQAGGKTQQSEIHKLVNSIWSNEKLPGQWKETITLPVFIKGAKTVCSNYRGISLLSDLYNILLNILLSRLSPFIAESNGDYQCEFRHNRSTSDQIFFIHQILERKTGVK
jgi:hypothetical protein